MYRSGRLHFYASVRVLWKRREGNRSRLSACREFGFDDQILLLNDQAKMRETEQAITNFMRSTANFKLFYFAGHGAARDDDGSTSLPRMAMNALLESISGGSEIKSSGASGTVVVILDCCHAGSASVRDAVFSALRLVDIERVIPSLTQSRFLLAATVSNGIAEESTKLRQERVHFPCIGGIAWRG